MILYTTDHVKILHVQNLGEAQRPVRRGVEAMKLNTLPEDFFLRKYTEDVYPPMNSQQNIIQKGTPRTVTTYFIELGVFHLKFTCRDTAIKYFEFFCNEDYLNVDIKTKLPELFL